MNAIIGFSDLLLARHRPTDPSFQDIMNIKQNANRAANLVRQLLAFSRQRTVSPRTLNVNTVVSNLAHMLERALGEDIEIEITGLRPGEKLHEVLFGDHEAADGRGGRESEGGTAGIHGRFLGYLDELEKVARAHRVTLNLHRKDPIFRPMMQAFEELARWAPRLRHSHGLRPGKKLELARVLNRTGHVLGRQAFAPFGLGPGDGIDSGIHSSSQTTTESLLAARVMPV